MRIFSLILFFSIGFWGSLVAQTNTLAVTEMPQTAAFPLTKASVYYDTADAKVVAIAAKAFVGDVQAISQQILPLIASSTIIANYAVVVGTIGHSALIDQLVKEKRIDVASLKNKWENFSINIVNQSGKSLLVIAGSDRRGTAFGIFQLSRLMGVSPFCWWADMHPAPRKQLFVSGKYVSVTPSVKYRGIFLNDEDWGLQPWAAKNMDIDIKDIGPNTYAKIFELMLRLKANYIWPAMHPCTKAFYFYKGNPKVADDYAIVVGGSHCEPMLRNNVFEWAENYPNEYGKKPGEWRYDVNPTEMYQYWNDRVKEAVHYESVYTVGMRGIHDGGMPGPKDVGQKVALLQKVITDQRSILQQNFNQSATSIPQIFVPYKEVLNLYRKGLQLPEDVTIIWPDDNYGYLRQLPDANERKRSGGHGVYYHLSYWGAPADYLWLSTTSPALIAYELTKAYHYNAKKLWVFNVGDLKPAELELQFAMDMAWDMNTWNVNTAANYTSTWAAETFGEKFAAPIAAIKNSYYQLANSGKPEHLHLVHFSDKEIAERLSNYNAVAAKATALKASIPAHLQDAYFQLVWYPVMGAYLQNQKILLAQQSLQLAANGNKLALQYAAKAKQSFDSIKIITNIYSTKIAGGKWNGMMSWQPRKQKVFDMPSVATEVLLAKADSAAKIVGSDSATEALVIPIEKFTVSNKAPNLTVKNLPLLGIGNSGVTILPTDLQKWPETEIKDAVCLSYTVQLPPGNYKAVVKCLPTFNVDNAKKLRYAIACNNESLQEVNVHTEAETPVWKENVVRGYSLGETLHQINGGATTIRLYLKDINLIANTLTLYKQPK